MIDLPEPDRRRSPRTGLTRAHWGAVADGLLLALRPYATDARAGFLLPGPVSAAGAASDALEAFARSFLVVAFRIAGDGGADPHRFLEQYADGIAAGTDPGSPDAWPRPDRVGQAKVEAASIALGLDLTRPWLWDRLEPAVRGRVLDWLGAVVHEDYPPINWVWFQIVAETFLAAEGGRWDAADVERGLAVHESLARAGGWYSDGPERAFDHYDGWAFSVYPLLWARMHGAERFGAAARAERWRTGLSSFVDDQLHLIGADGMPLLQGRSLIYRFATAAPLWMGAITGATSAPPGLLRRAASGTLLAFLRHGAVDGRGLLPVGLRGAWPRMAQSYSGAGSPYWAAKGLLGLLLPPDHPVWTAQEVPLPVERADFVRRIVAPGWIASGTVGDGIVRVVNHGTDHDLPGSLRTDAPLYARLGYSTTTFPPVAAEPADQAVRLLDGVGRGSHRAGFVPVAVPDPGGGALAAGSTWTPHWVETAPDPRDHGSGRDGAATIAPPAATTSVVRGAWEVRVVVGGVGALEVSGWAIADDRPLDGTTRSDGVASVVVPLVGSLRAGIRAADGASPLGAHVAVPVLVGEAPGPLVVAVGLGTGLDASPSAQVTGGTVEVVWPDGSRSSVPLPAPVEGGTS